MSQHRALRGCPRVAPRALPFFGDEAVIARVVEAAVSWVSVRVQQVRLWASRVGSGRSAQAAWWRGWGHGGASLRAPSSHGAFAGPPFPQARFLYRSKRELRKTAGGLRGSYDICVAAAAEPKCGGAGRNNGDDGPRNGALEGRAALSPSHPLCAHARRAGIPPA